jgi:hypothetical protein
MTRLRQIAVNNFRLARLAALGGLRPQLRVAARALAANLEGFERDCLAGRARDKRKGSRWGWMWKGGGDERANVSWWVVVVLGTQVLA